MAGGVNYIPEEFGKPKEYCHPHHRIPTDLEPAFVIGKDETCCPPTGDPCECVTSGDIEKWNFVYDNFSALADIDVSAINDFVDDVSALNSSADNWNSAFETVSSNSANWNIVDDLKASVEDHEERISDLEDFADDAEDRLSAIDSKLENLHFDNDIADPEHSISGDGSISAPFGVNNYAALKTTNDNYKELNRHIVKFSADGSNNTLYEFDGAAYNVARIDGRLSGIDQTNDTQNTNIQRNYELITEVANRQKGKQDKLAFGYNNSGYIVSINNSALIGEMGGLTGDLQGALDQVYENSANWSEVSAKVDTSAFDETISAIDEKVDDKLDTSAFSDVSGTFYTTDNPSAFIDNAVDDLVNYYTKTETYSQTEINEMLANFGGFEVVELTTGTNPHPDVSDPSTKIIYLTKDSTSSATDPYTEWIYTESNGWEIIGETTVDLSGYQPISAMSAYYTKSETSGKQEIQDALNLKQNILTAGTDLVINNGVIGVNTNGTITNSADMSFVAGSGTYASGIGAAAFGVKTSALGDYSFAEGYNTSATGIASHAEGAGTSAVGVCSHAEGDITSAVGENSHAEGQCTNAVGENSHAEGLFTSAVGYNSHTEGEQSTASGLASHAEGRYTNAAGNTSHTEGYYTTANGSAAHTEGYKTNAAGNYSHSEGNNTNAKGEDSHSEGLNTFAADVADHVEGIGSYIEQGGCNHVEGFQYHSYMGNGPASDYYGTNKVKFYNASSSTISGYTINGSLYELVKAFKDKFIVSCEYGSSTEYHYTSNSFFKPKLYSIVDVNLIEETNQLEITIDGTIDCQSGGSIYLFGPTSITSISGYGGSLTPGQSISTFTTTGLGFPGNNLENVRPDNCFLSFTVSYTPAGASSTSFYKIIKPSSITYDSTTNVYTYACEESIEIPSDATAGGYIFSVYVLNSVSYGCNHIEGRDNVIKYAECSHAEGVGNFIIGGYSHAEGGNTSATFQYSHTEGFCTKTEGACAHAEGYYTVASNGQAGYQDAEHAEGYQTSAIGRGSHAEGSNTIASSNGGQCHAEGYQTSAKGDHAHAEGQSTKALNSNAHAEGYGSLAFGTNSHAEGYTTYASGYASHAEGNSTIAFDSQSHAEGYGTSALGFCSHTEGNNTLATSSNSHTEGYGTSATNYAAHAEGGYTSAAGHESHAEGYGTSAAGQYSHAEGQQNQANSTASHAEGLYTTAAGGYSHAEGQSTLAANIAAHAEGYNTSAEGNQAHAEGQSTLAANTAAHAEGNSTLSTGEAAHAEGAYTSAIGYASHAAGGYTIASGSYTTVIGKYNSNQDDLFVVGNGTDTTARSDAFIVDRDGKASATVLATSGIPDVEAAISAASAPIFTGNEPGLVPSASPSDSGKALRGDGTWGSVGGGVTIIYTSATEELHLDFSNGGN